MEISKLDQMIRGWFIGNFEPSVLKTEDFEVGVLKHKKGEYWAPHYHKVATEYNVLIEGKMTIQDRQLEKGDIFILRPYEIADPIYLEDCVVLVVKSPSVPSDKYLVQDLGE